MRQTKVLMSSITCNNLSYNKKDVLSLKEVFLKKKPIPSPWINNKKEVIFHHSTYFLLKELNHEKIYVVESE